MASQDFVEIISSSQISIIKDADAALNQLLKTLNVTVATANKLNISGSSASKPSQLNANTSSNNSNRERTIKALERERLAEIKLQQDREKAFAKYEAQLSRENAKLEAAQSVYAKVQTKLNALNKEYRDLAVQKELTGKLTDSESKRYDFLSAKITKYDTVLKGVDAAMGKYNRNVGNYASGFNPLNNAINQLTREAPAFANSIQTGFLAISNNLPTLFDALEGIIKQNKILQSQGQPTSNVFKQLATSVLSVGTALSLGVTLLTLFGDEIIDAIAGTKAKAQADKEAKEAVEAKSKAEEEYNNIIRTSSSEEISRSKLLFEDAKNVNLTMKERLQAINDLRERYPEYLQSLTDQQILSGKTAENESKLNDALLKRGIALALQDKIGKAYARLTDEIIKQQEAQQKANNLDVTLNNNKSKLTTAQIKLAQQLRNAEVLASNDRQKAIKGDIQELINLYNQYSPYLDAVRESTAATKEATEATEAYAETNSKVAFERNISILEERLSLMNKENIMYGFLETQLTLLKKAYDALYGSQEDIVESTEKLLKFGTEEYYTDRINNLKKEQAAVADNAEQYQLYNRIIKTVQDDLDRLTGKTADVEKLNDSLKSYFTTFTEGFFKDAGLSSLNQFFTVGEDGLTKFQARFKAAGDDIGKKAAVTFLAVSEVAKEAFAFINQASAAQFDAEYARLEKRRDLAIKFAGDSATAQDEINRQYDEKQREIKRRELQAQKEQAIFNSIVNTAQGVTAALAEANIPLSIIIAALGAAQVAFISSQQIPAYKMGTDNHKGGLAIVGDGNKHEAVWQPSLGWSITPDNSALVSLEKGSKVFPDLASSGIFDNGLPDMIELNSGGLTEAAMDRVLHKAFGSMQQVNYGLNFDEKGFKKYISQGHNITENRNNSLSFKGKTFGRG